MDNTSQRTAPEIPTEVNYIAGYWPDLPPHVREAIITVVDGALSTTVLEQVLAGQANSRCNGAGDQEDPAT